jgi:uncharacterized protein (TIGR04255 family)
LKIAQQVPADFQEAIRGRFPSFQPEQALLIQSTFDQPVRHADPQPPIYRFRDKKELRTVSLGHDFYALSTTHYESWNSFADDLDFITQIVLSIYKIPYSIRVGLRYINTLNTQNTGMKLFNPDVLDILRPELTALLYKNEIEDPRLAITQIRAEQTEGEFTFRSGVIQEEKDRHLQQSFLLDFDRYIEEDIELSVKDLLERCENYHADIYSAFRWCIQANQLHVFQPAAYS